MPKNTVPRSRRDSAPKKPKTKPAAKAAPNPDVVREVHGGPTTGPNCNFPDWVDFKPLADFRLVAWESDESTVEVLLTSEEYCILKDHLARLRGHAVPTEATNAN